VTDSFVSRFYVIATGPCNIVIALTDMTLFPSGQQTASTDRSWTGNPGDFYISTSIYALV